MTTRNSRKEGSPATKNIRYSKVKRRNKGIELIYKNSALGLGIYSLLYNRRDESYIISIYAI